MRPQRGLNLHPATLEANLAEAHLAAPHQDLHQVLVQARARAPHHHLHHHRHQPHQLTLLDILGSQRNQERPRKDGIIVTVAESIISAANVVAAPTTTITHAENRAGAAVTTRENLTTPLVLLHHLCQYQQYCSKYQHQAESTQQQ